MIAVMFEVSFGDAAAKERYLAIAGALAHELRAIEGFVSVERFASTTDALKLLSLSIWRDEQAVARWRNHEAHRRAQRVGRDTLFRDYRLRIAAVVRDYGKT